MAYFIIKPENATAPIVVETVKEEVKDTYTYTNHGFSIELPKGYVPKENIFSDRPMIEIYLPNGNMTYYTDASFWGDSYSSSKDLTYVKDVKIGVTTFQLFKHVDSFGIVAPEYSFWLKKGNIGYHFYTFNNQTGDYGAKELETFKFVGWSQVEGNKEDLVSFSIKPGQEVSGAMKATGILSGGYFFEGNLPVAILDANKNITKYGPGHGQATTDWMTAGPVSFEIDFDFSKMPKGKAYIKMTQDDPSGGENGFVPGFVIVPIVIK